MTSYTHTHDAGGHFLRLSQTQDAAGAHCEHCGRTLDQDTRPHHHAAACPAYAPHPASIAAAGAEPA